VGFSQEFCENLGKLSTNRNKGIVRREENGDKKNGNRKNIFLNIFLPLQKIFFDLFILFLSLNFLKFMIK
jgi:hypothetical protein